MLPRLFALSLLLLSACGCPAAQAQQSANAAVAAAAAVPTTSKSPKKLPPAPPGVVIEQDVAYLAPQRKERLDLYLPANRDASVRSPAIVIIHGGGWTGGDKAADREFNIGTTLAAAGYVCASINYKLDGDDRWPTNLFDCKNAVRFLRACASEYQIDPDRIGVIGGSAGGHLALMVAYTSDVPELTPTDSPYKSVSDRVRCVVDLYGITDPRTRRKTDEQGKPIGPPSTQSALLPHRTPTADAEKWSLAAPVSHVSKNTPPTLIIHGTADTTVDRDQATQLAEKLQSAGVEHQLIRVEGIGHTFDLQKWRGKPLPQDLRPVVKTFFDAHLKGD
jgi:acetyl esterase/lipase